jgi:HPt (histidine-containing phosphotransfer) domain-containing protein
MKMTVQELYENLGGNYNEALSRMMKDTLVGKFAGMFVNDPSYNQLVAAMDEADAHKAFEAAHTLKGVSANLAFSVLFEKASAVTEALRGADTIDGAVDLMPALTEEYNKTITAINEFQA